MPLHLRIWFVAIAALLHCSTGFAATKLALIFDGPTIDADSRDRLADLIRGQGLRVRFVRPTESTPQLLKHAAVYVVPGGEDITRAAEGWTARDRAAIRSYVVGGGRYLGVCLGGYWLGQQARWPDTPPFSKRLNLFPGVVRSHSPTPEDRIEPIRWRDGSIRHGYFQEGPDFDLRADAGGTVFGRFADGKIASYVGPAGRGKIAVSSPHWEASAEWYKDIEDRLHPGRRYDLPNFGPANVRLGVEMFRELMAP